MLSNVSRLVRTNARPSMVFPEKLDEAGPEARRIHANPGNISVRSETSQLAAVDPIGAY